MTKVRMACLTGAAVLLLAASVPAWAQDDGYDGPPRHHRDYGDGWDHRHHGDHGDRWHHRDHEDWRRWHHHHHWDHGDE